MKTLLLAIASLVLLANRWALWDSLVGYAVSVSKDSMTWSESVATSAGELGITRIAFPPQTARCFRITQTGASSACHWSIYELDVF